MRQTIKSPKVAEQIAKHIEDLILEGSLHAGEALISERDLAERLNVSRPAVRDGLKILEERGLIDNNGGRGAKIAQLGAAAISDPLIALLSQRMEVADDYLEFRDIVESSAAALAAQRANAADIRRIQSCLEAIDNAHAEKDPEREAHADAELHIAIYEASQNVVILQIMQALSGNLRTDVVHNRTRLFSVAQIRDLLRDQHKSIADAIVAREPEKAREAAHAHLSYLSGAIREIREAEARLDVSLRRLQGGGLSAQKTSER